MSTQPIQPTPTFFESIALPLVKRGWDVAPCYPRDKQVHTKLVPTPLTMKTKSIIKILKWAEAEPNANVCVYAEQKEGGLLFLDKDGAGSLSKKYEAETGKTFPKTLLVRSSIVSDGNGGTYSKGHWYFLQTPRTRALEKNISELSTGGMFSLRVRNEYVASIGSIHPDTGKPYEIVDDVPVLSMPDDLLDWLLKQVVAKKDNSTPSGPRELIKHGQIHPWMLTQAGKLRAMGLDADGIEGPLLALVHANCEAPIDEEKVRQMAKSICNFAPGQPGVNLSMPQTAVAAPVVPPPQFKHPKVEGSHRDYVVSPVLGQKDGWFPLGSVSLIGGSSGSNKSTWALDLLHAQARGQSIWGHATYSRPYLVFTSDRSEGSHLRTMERMGYQLDEIPVRFLPPVTDGAAIKSILDHIESEPTLPQVVFVEGADMLVADPNKGHFIVPFISQLQKIAERYHIAIILSVGAPKMKVGEGYSAKRDSILGSEKWSRMSETVVAMQFVDGDDVDIRRACFVMLRNGPAERFNLTLQNGKLVIDNAPRPQQSTTFTRARDMVEAAKDFYTRLFANKSPNSDGLLVVTADDHSRALAGHDINKRARTTAMEFLGIRYDRGKLLYVKNPRPTPTNAVNLEAGRDSVEAEEVDEGQTSADLTAQVDRAVKLFAEGKSSRQVADALGITKSKAARWMKKWCSTEAF